MINRDQQGRRGFGGVPSKEAARLAALHAAQVAPMGLTQTEAGETAAYPNIDDLTIPLNTPAWVTDNFGDNIPEDIRHLLLAEAEAQQVRKELEILEREAHTHVTPAPPPPIVYKMGKYEVPRGARRRTTAKKTKTLASMGTTSLTEATVDEDHKEDEGLPYVDIKYAFLFIVDEEAPEFDPMEMKLNHEPDYECRGRDFMRAETIAEAYEASFSGSKRVGVVSHGVDAIKTAAKSVPKSINKLTCDYCNREILKLGDRKPFFFCVKCRGRGNRFEACTRCFEEQMSGKGQRQLKPEELPDHFRECLHEDLQCCRSIAEAYPTGKLKFLACDLCQLKIIKKEQTGIPFQKCVTCEKKGRRFELCMTCDEKVRTTKPPAPQHGHRPGQGHAHGQPGGHGHYGY